VAADRRLVDAVRRLAFSLVPMRRPAFAAAALGEEKRLHSADAEEELQLSAALRSCPAVVPPALINGRARHHQTHMSFDTAAAAMTTLTPYHWPMLPPAAPAMPAAMPQVVL